MNKITITLTQDQVRAIKDLIVDYEVNHNLAFRSIEDMTQNERSNLAFLKRLRFNLTQAEVEQS